MIRIGDRVRCYGAGMRGGQASGNAGSIRKGEVYQEPIKGLDAPGTFVAVAFDEGGSAVFNVRQVFKLKKKEKSK